MALTIRSATVNDAPIIVSFNLALAAESEELILPHDVVEWVSRARSWIPLSLSTSWQRTTCRAVAASSARPW